MSDEPKPDPSIADESDVHVVEVGGRTLYLVGTAQIERARSRTFARS